MSTCALQLFNLDEVAAAHPEHLRQILGQQQAACGQRLWSTFGIEHALHPRAAGLALESSQYAHRADAQADADAAQSLDRGHAGQGGEFGQGVIAFGFDEADGEIVALRQRELLVDHEVQRVLLEHADGQHAAGHRDAEHGGQRFHRPPRQLPEDHAGRLVEPAPRQRAFQPRGAIARWRLRTHRLGGR